MRSTSLALACGLAALSACGSGGSPALAPTGTDGHATIYLTDAPFPFDAITRVDVHVVRIELSPQADTSAGPPQWITVATPDRTFNLLDFQNGTTALLGDAQIPAGQYAAVRVTIDPARSSLTDASGHVLSGTTAPAGPGIDWNGAAGQAMLYAQVEEPMAVDERGQDIVIDFDVGRSFQYDGGDRFTFIPWLRAITRAGSGAVTGLVQRAGSGAPIPNAAVSVTMASDTVLALYTILATSRTGADGHFVVSFLRPGPYRVVVTDPSTGQDAAARRVEVRAGAAVDAGVFGF